MTPGANAPRARGRHGSADKDPAKHTQMAKLTTAGKIAALILVAGIAYGGYRVFVAKGGSLASLAPEAKGTGYDIKIIRKIVALRKQDKDKRREEEEILELYMNALGMAEAAKPADCKKAPQVKASRGFCYAKRDAGEWLGIATLRF